LSTADPHGESHPGSVPDNRLPRHVSALAASLDLMTPLDGEREAIRLGDKVWDPLNVAGLSHCRVNRRRRSDRLAHRRADRTLAQAKHAVDVGNTRLC
jgi:hypothetical protein